MRRSSRILPTTSRPGTALPILRPLPKVLVVRQASLYTTRESYLASLRVLSANLETTHDFHANLHYSCQPRRCVGFLDASGECRPLPVRSRSVETARSGQLRRHLARKGRPYFPGLAGHAAGGGARP